MERRALERVFRILQILETSEEFARMFAALSADVPAARAGAREVIGQVLDGGFRDALLALTDSVAPAERLQAAAAAVPASAAETTLRAWRLWTKSPSASGLAASLAEVVAAIRSDRNVMLASVAAYHLPSTGSGSPSPQEAPRAAS
jgi:hypothetical protein